MEDFMGKKKNKNREKRPIAVTIIAIGIVILFFVRIYQSIKPLIEEQVIRNIYTAPISLYGSLTTHGKAVLESLLYLILAIGLIVVLLGFLRMRRWSWVFLMTWVGFSMVVGLEDYFYFGSPNYVIMASDVIIAFALSQSDVQRIFGIRSDTGENVI
jgi:hypothetical protein